MGRERKAEGGRTGPWLDTLPCSSLVFLVVIEEEDGEVLAVSPVNEEECYSPYGLGRRVVYHKRRV